MTINKEDVFMALDATALFNISYGLYVLTSHDGQRDCGCISNSVMQLTDTPLRLAVSVNKKNRIPAVIQNTISCTKTEKCDN